MNIKSEERARGASSTRPTDFDGDNAMVENDDPNGIKRRIMDTSHLQEGQTQEQYEWQEHLRSRGIQPPVHLQGEKRTRVAAEDEEKGSQ